MICPDCKKEAVLYGIDPDVPPMCDECWKKFTLKYWMDGLGQPVEGEK